MKKFLLSIAAVAFAGSAFAAEVVLAETDFSKVNEYGFWKSDRTTAEVKDGALVITNEEAAENFWDVQYIVANDFALKAGTTYTINVTIKDFSGSLHYNLGTWGDNVAGAVDVKESADWQTVTINATAQTATDSTAHLLLQSGEFVGSYSIASVVITYNEDGDKPEDPVNPGEYGKEVYSIDYATSNWAFYVMGYTPEVVDGVLTSEYPGEWYQYFIADQIKTEVGKNYVAVVKIKGSEPGNAALNMGWGWGDNDILKSTIAISTEWTEVAQTFENIGGTSCNLVLQPGTYPGKVEVAWAKVYEQVSSAVEAVESENAEAVYYNLQGLAVKNPVPGTIYIVKKGSKVSKVIF